MMISDFVALVRRIMSLETSGLITMIIIAIIVGAITHKVISGLQSIVVLTVVNLVALLVWFEVWQSSEILLVGITATVCLAVAGQWLYRMMLRS